MASFIQQYLIGRVSKTVLWTTLLPLSLLSFFGTLIGAAFLGPIDYDWRERAISALTSPHHNPQGYWLAALGIMAAILLVSPFAGYVAHRLRGLTPRLARSAGLAFAFSFGLMLLAVLAQLAQPVVGLRWLHEFLARVSAGSFIGGMFCCCGCALKDRFRNFGGKRSLSAALTYYWVSLILLPTVCLASLGALMLLGQGIGQVWAEDLRQSFRHTMLWHLAFCEWIGILLAFAFFTGSVLLLPRCAPEGRTSQSGLPHFLVPAD